MCHTRRTPVRQQAHSFADAEQFIGILRNRSKLTTVKFDCNFQAAFLTVALLDFLADQATSHRTDYASGY